MEKNTVRTAPVYPESGNSIEFYQNRSWYSFVPANNHFMGKAKDAALELSKTLVFPIGIVAVKDGVIVGRAGNGNGYHEEHENDSGHRKGCVRRFLSEEREGRGLPKFKGGEGFELCPGCSTDYHAEANLIRSVVDKNSLKGAEVYMYGHFWCCEACWEKMKEAQIAKVNLCGDVDFSDKNNVKSLSEELKAFRSRI
jgi:deoxycytidylate deaminase